MKVLSPFKVPTTIDLRDLCYNDQVSQGNGVYSLKSFMTVLGDNLEDSEYVAYCQRTVKDEEGAKVTGWFEFSKQNVEVVDEEELFANVFPA
jgi:hypothetical protein